MLFLVDGTKKIIFGWSAKCGCSHIKNIYWFLQNGNIDNIIHTSNDNCKLPDDLTDYTTIIIIRNPFKRIVSGFLDKYKKDGSFRKYWKYDNITFSMFINEIEKKNWKMIDKHHFTPQTTEQFNDKIFESKNIKFFDIENIDYEYIEKLYNIDIPEIILNKKQGHERQKYDKDITTYVYDMNLDDYIFNNIDIKYFYNEELKNKICEIYKNDFILFKKYGFDFTI